MTREEYQRYALGICRRPGCGQPRLVSGEFCVCCADDEAKAAERFERSKKHGYQGQ